ncbi:adenylyltransferase/cytidyltransferase family protein [Jannaschia seohaensis]|uniref:Glycerol-3-phosphate cytidylyltransferase n=1 Tax=Jannaschia seohaensis TaxID=475081 RepID=A0A2Y9B2J7_9RHOB|nr:adenylyltransferase/cytidyltransferase family protein [Jannaschia seohaensis]PWJ12946.1 glycerol-3-phosphate cytidylyltransferase [Jannaschia seohaensis]SSA50754.1 glycerol-3-phosphate cytidylyltransferase [Jannaschia seohaensis]
MTTGYTTGVYDLFHIGHLNLLRRAAEQCDRLIVGVTSDELSFSRKNKYPIIPLKERMEIVGALRFVDEVVVQDDMDKFAAWERHHFDKMFVGDDWKGHPKWVALEERFRPHGVEIVYFPYTEHTSSSRLREVLDAIAAPGRPPEHRAAIGSSGR